MVVDDVRFGYVGWLQQLPESAFGPVCGAWSEVMISIPSSLYAGEARIFGTTDFRNVSAGPSPEGAPVVHGVGLPSLHGPGAM